MKSVDGTWVSHSATTRIALAIVLVTAAAGMVYPGARLRRPGRLPQPGWTAKSVVVAWVLAIIALLVCAHEFVSALRQQHLLHGVRLNPIEPVIGACVVVIFATILIRPRSHECSVPLVSAAVGAVAVPMILEVPFGLITMTRTYPPMPPDPVAYRVLFFRALVPRPAHDTVIPAIRLDGTPDQDHLLLRNDAGGIRGLSAIRIRLPPHPRPYAFNVPSKLLAFATALTLFLPPRVQFETPKRERENGD